jgi:hypothetical protein
VRPLGSRKLPREISWGAVLVHMLGSGEGQATTPSADQITAAAASLKGATPKSTAKSASESPEHETAPPSMPSPTPTSAEQSP